MHIHYHASVEAALRHVLALTAPCCGGDSRSNAESEALEAQIDSLHSAWGQLDKLCTALDAPALPSELLDQLLDQLRPCPCARWRCVAPDDDACSCGVADQTIALLCNAPVGSPLFAQVRRAQRREPRALAGGMHAAHAATGACSPAVRVEPP